MLLHKKGNFVNYYISLATDKITLKIAILYNQKLLFMHLSETKDSYAIVLVVVIRIDVNVGAQANYAIRSATKN